jgi:putative ABC transport system permease protein
MKLRSLVWKEFLQRPLPLVTCLVAVVVVVASFVAVQTITRSSEMRVAAQLEQLGANLLVLPPSATLQDYYAADLHGATLSEEYVTRLALARKVGVDGMAPKLSVTAELEGRPVVLTGILPRADIQAKSAWGGVDLLTGELAPLGSKHAGCKGRCHVMVDEDDPSALAISRVVHQLPPDATLVGADIARRHGVSKGDRLELFGEAFEVAAILQPTGTVDDGRVFAHLHTVQRITGSGPVVNVIEIISCCEDAAAGLVGELRSLLPEANVVTIRPLVQTQIAVNRLVGRLSYALLAILIVAGAIGVASVMYTSVAQQQRELGTLMALGAKPSTVARLVLVRIALVGLIGGVVGVGCGLLVAGVIGPGLLNAPVVFSLGPPLVGAAAALLVALAASYLPARRAARLDPCVCFRSA